METIFLFCQEIDIIEAALNLDINRKNQLTTFFS